MKFYYFINGNEIDELSLSLNQIQLWKRNEQHGRVWLKAHVNIQQSIGLKSYNLIFEAIIGKGSIDKI